MSHKFKFSIIMAIAVLFFLSTGAFAAAPAKMAGKVFIYDNGNGIARIHTYMAPFKAAANTSHVIELKDKLVLVDMQFVEAFAKEFRAYVDSLGKPVDRIYLSHEHPDHWFGSIAFQDAKVYALEGVIGFVKKIGPAIIKKKGKPAAIPNFAGTVKLGTEKIGGLTFEFSQFQNSESGNALVIALPELKTLIVQDLIYSNCHLYMGHDSFNVWISTLEKLKAQYKDYEWFLGGHGEPATTTAVIDNNIVYLNEANKAFDMAGGDLNKIKEYLFKRFPDLKAQFFVPFSVGIALKKPNQHK